MKRFHLLTLLLFLASALPAALVPDMKFRRLDTRDGLSNPQVNCIFQDSRGYVWIGTPYGLNRYDGYRFHTFYSDPNDSTTMKNNYVEHVYEAFDGRLWIKQGMNFCIYDPKTEQFDRNPTAYLSRLLGFSSGIDRLHIDDRKCFWVKTYDEGLYYYNPYTKKEVLFRYGYGANDFRREFWVSSFANFRKSVLVISSNGDIVSINGEDGRISWRSDYLPRHGAADKQAYELQADAQSNYWVQSPGAFFAYLQRDHRWYFSVGELLEAKGITDFPTDIFIWNVRIDRNGWLWIATDHEGLFVVDLKNRQWRQFKSSKSDETTLCDNTLRRLYLDPAGRMWIGSYKNGLSLYVTSLSNLKNIDLGDINCITEDSLGNYWLGTNDRGILCYNPKTGEQLLYGKANSGLASDAVISSVTSRDGSMWFGTYNGGLVHYRDGRFTTYMATGQPNSLGSNNVWGLTEDYWGNIWIGTLGAGIQRLNPKTSVFTTWNTNNSKLKSNYISSMRWIRKGWLMAGTSDFYTLVHPHTGKMVNVTIPAVQGQSAAMAATTAVLEDSRGLIWHGSSAGACVIDPATRRQWMFDMKNGLYSSSVMAIEEDLYHTMWVVTDHGVSHIVPTPSDDGQWTFTVRSYNHRDGLQQGPFNQRAIYRTRGGRIIVGGQNGIDIIDPAHLGRQRTSEQPVFSGLVLFDTQVGAGDEVGGRVVLDEALDVCRELDLRYSENQFTIQLASNSGEVHNPSRFVYMLQGFNDKWIKTRENNPDITYMSLPSGSYTLCVRMLNSDGTMADAESRLAITIHPPFYRSWWAWLLYVVAAALLLRYGMKHFRRV